MVAVRTPLTGASTSVSQGTTTAGSTAGAGTFGADALLPGDVLVFIVACDNLSAATPTMTIDSNPAEAGPWTELVDTATNASAAAGCALGIWTTTVKTAVAGGGTMSTPTVTLSGSVAAKAWTLIAFRGCTETLRGAVTTNKGASTTPQATSVSANIGDAVIGCLAAEQNTIPTADADTTNGSWTAAQGFATTGGGSAANVSTMVQTKVPTVAGTQSFDPTTASTDWIASAIVLKASEPTPPAIVAPSNAVHRAGRW